MFIISRHHRWWVRELRGARWTCHHHRWVLSQRTKLWHFETILNGNLIPSNIPHANFVMDLEEPLKRFLSLRISILEPNCNSVSVCSTRNDSLNLSGWIRSRCFESSYPIVGRRSRTFRGAFGFSIFQVVRSLISCWWVRTVSFIVFVESSSLKWFEGK